MDTVLDSSKIETFRREYLALMKTLPRVTDFDSATALRKSFREWSDAFEKFMYRDFIGDLKQEILNGEINKDWGNGWEKRIREKVWDLVIQRPPIDLEDSYNTKEMQYSRYLRDVKSFESRSRRYSRETWKLLNDFVEWYGNQTGKKTFTVHVPETQKFTIAGFDVTFIGLDTIENDRDKHFNSLSDAFKKYRESAGRVLPLLLQKDLPFIVDYKNEGAFHVGAEYEGTHVTIIGWSMESDVDKIVHVIAHEMAHHIWHTVLSRENRDLWVSVVNGDLGTLDLREVVKKYNPKDGWILNTENIKNSDPVLFTQLEGLQYSLGVPRELKNAYQVQDLIDYLDAGREPILNVHTRPISGYANKNTGEAFAEAIGLMVAFGPQVVDERIRSVLKEMLPSLKIASEKSFISKHKVQGDRIMNKQMIASELVKIAKDLMAVDGDLQRVADVVKSSSFMSLRGPLKNLKIGNVDFQMGDGSGAMWMIKTRRGKTIVVTSVKNADPSSDDIVVGDFVVGYL
jgi:hypothetical protein